MWPSTAATSPASPTLKPNEMKELIELGTKLERLTRGDSRLAYGFVAGPGAYETTLTRPALFERYPDPESLAAADIGDVEQIIKYVRWLQKQAGIF